MHGTAGGAQAGRSVSLHQSGTLIPEDTQCILVLGGDGTLLQAARDVVHREIPDAWCQPWIHWDSLQKWTNSLCTAALDKLMEDNYEIEERMMLTGTVWRDGKIIGRDVASQ